MSTCDTIFVSSASKKNKIKFSYVLNQTQLKDCKALFRLVAKRKKEKGKNKDID